MTPETHAAQEANIMTTKTNPDFHDLTSVAAHAAAAGAADFAGRNAARLAARLGTRAIPGVGQATLAYDIASLGYEGITDQPLGDTVIGGAIENTAGAAARGALKTAAAVSGKLGFTETARLIDQDGRELLFGDRTRATGASRTAEDLDAINPRNEFAGKNTAAGIIDAALNIVANTDRNRQHPDRRHARSFRENEIE